MIRFIFEKQSHRFFILFELYKECDASIDLASNLQQVADNLGMGLRTFIPAFKYLQMEELIRVKSSQKGYMASITHSGIKAIEEVFRNENESTYYFPSFREMNT